MEKLTEEAKPGGGPLHAAVDVSELLVPNVFILCGLHPLVTRKGSKFQLLLVFVPNSEIPDKSDALLGPKSSSIVAAVVQSVWAMAPSQRYIQGKVQCQISRCHLNKILQVGLYRGGSQKGGEGSLYRDIEHAQL